MHIDNPQMRGLFFCGVTRHVCRGQDRLRIFGGPPPNTKLLQGLGELAPSTKPVAGVRGIVTNARGAHSPSAITRMTFGVMDIERRAIPYLSYAYPIVRFQSGSNQVPMRFQWRQGAHKGQVIGICDSIYKKTVTPFCGITVNFNVLFI